MNIGLHIPLAKKSLGQHWLNDDATLRSIVTAAGLTKSDTVLEVGPGLGSLTTKLVDAAHQVIAVELDSVLINSLELNVPAPNLRIIQQDILSFDLTSLPPNYIVVANIPYYLTSNLLRVLCESTNPFLRAVLLIQKEVAERVVAAPGKMSVLSVSVQYYCEARLGQVVPASLFSPPPKVDSQLLILEKRPQPLFRGIDSKMFFRIVKAGFAQRRKTIVNSLSGGLHLERPFALALIEKAGIDSSRRPQTLSLDEWFALYEASQEMSPALL
jgi:16S rRNA (adenine1518-N6/adenine1519-N6)-dimethyltransferase